MFHTGLLAAPLFVRALASQDMSKRTGDVAGQHVLAVHEHAAPPGRGQAVHQALALHLARHPRPKRRPAPANSLYV